MHGHNSHCSAQVLVDAIRKLQALVRGATPPAAAVATVLRPVVGASPPPVGLQQRGSGQLGRAGSSPLGAALGLGLGLAAHSARVSPARAASGGSLPDAAAAMPAALLAAVRAASDELPSEQQLAADRYRSALQSAMSDPQAAAAAVMALQARDTCFYANRAPVLAGPARQRVLSALCRGKCSSFAMRHMGTQRQPVLPHLPDDSLLTVAFSVPLVSKAWH